MPLKRIIRKRKEKISILEKAKGKYGSVEVHTSKKKSRL